MPEEDTQNGHGATEQVNFERFLLGSIIYGNAKERMLDVVQIIPAEHASYFTNPDNSTTYQILCQLSVSDQMPEDAALITNELWTVIHAHMQDYNCTFRSKDQLSRYILGLSSASLPGMQMDAYKDYAERIKWGHDQRAYEQLGQEISNRAKTTPFSEREDFITGTESKVNNLSLEVRNSVGLRQVEHTTSEIRESLRRMQRWEPIEMGLKTGLSALDTITGGFNPGELIVLAASTGYGKSAVASSIGLNVAMNQENRRSVMSFSLEMMDDQMSSRAIANLARVNMKQHEAEYEKVVSGFYKRQYKDPSVNDMMKQKLTDQNDRIGKAIDFYEKLPLFTDITPALNANEIKSMVMQKQRAIENDPSYPPVGLIIVDYLQIMSPVDARSSSNRTDEVGDMSRRLKRLAKETGIPVLCLAQLNRQAQEGEAPSLSMLRESGSIEQDADKVMFIWGPNKGKTEDDYTDVPPNGDIDIAKRLAWQKDQMKLKITVAKNRSGEQGTCDVVGDYGFQYFCTQSDDYKAKGESFDTFFEKYYMNTRSGEDLFWPLPKDRLPIQDFQSVRHLPRPEMLYIDQALKVVRASDTQDSSNGGTRMVQTMPVASAQASRSEVATDKVESSAPTSIPEPTESIADDSEENGPLDRFKPKVVDDVMTDFEDSSDDDSEIDYDDLDSLVSDGDGDSNKVPSDAEHDDQGDAPASGDAGSDDASSDNTLDSMFDDLDDLFV